MTTLLTLNTDRGVDGTPRVTAVGEIDISNIDVFTEALAAATAVGCNCEFNLQLRASWSRIP